MSIRAKLRSRGINDALCLKAYDIIKEQDKKIEYLQKKIDAMTEKLQRVAALEFQIGEEI